MFFAFAYTLQATDLEDNPKKLEMEVSSGIIHQVDILFQKDSAFKNLVQIYKGGHQMWPTNKQGAFRGDATVVSFREYVELRGADNTLTAYLWTTDAAVTKQVVIQIGVLPKEIVMPLSFDELVRAVAGL